MGIKTKIGMMVILLPAICSQIQQAHATAIDLADATTVDTLDGANKFTINQAPKAKYVPTAGPVKCNGGTGTCTTVLLPATVTGVGVGNATNTATLKADLAAQFSAYTIAGFGASLNLNFNVTKYAAFNNGSSGGASMVVDYTAQDGAVLPANLHWIQVVTDNYNISGINGADLSAAKGLGKPENIVDNVGSVSPYYDLDAKGNPDFAVPPHFEDGPSRPEPTKANPTITWNATLFLVSDNNKAMTVYDGVNYGWQTTFSPVPLPASLPILASALIGVVGFQWRGARGRRV